MIEFLDVTDASSRTVLKEDLGVKATSACTWLDVRSVNVTRMINLRNISTADTKFQFECSLLVENK